MWSVRELTDPVNVTFLINGWRQRASLNGGVFSRLVVRTLNTPFGNPACIASSANARTESGVSGDGFTIIVQPAARAAPAFRKIILLQSVSIRLSLWWHSRNGKIPWDKSSSNTNWLLNCEDSSSRSRRSLNCSCDSLCFTSKPPSEAKSIVQLSLRLSKRFASLVGDDMSNVISVLTNESIPLQKPLRSGTRVDFLVRLESLMRGVYCRVNILGRVVRCRCPNFIRSRICRGMRFGSAFEMDGDLPTTSNLFPDFASTHWPPTSDLSLKSEAFLT